MKRRWIVILEIALLLALVAWIAVSMLGHTSSGVSVKVRLPGTRENAALVQNPDSTYRYDITRNDGSKLSLSPEELADRTFREDQGMTWWMRFLNITGPFELLWVTIGLLGQILFTGRMIVQWIVSEKRGESIVPPAFWWMSLIGASMLLAYFTWRKDIVGFIGQATGWLIYIRNIYLIYYKPRRFPVIPTGGTALLDPRDPDIQAEGKS